MAYNPNWQQEHEDSLNSEAWQARKRKYIDDHGYACQNCPATHSLELHHIAYDHELGTEPDQDLRLLCPACHASVHADTHLPTQKQRKDGEITA